MKTILSLLSCLILLLPAQGEEQSSKELLRDGLFEEEVNQDYKKAEAAYRAVTKSYDEERYFAGLAFFRLAEIARKSGNQEQAVALYRRVAGEFADQKEIAKRALEQLGDAGPDDKGMASVTPLNAPVSNAEALELQRLQKMERDSPDLLNGVSEDGWHPIHKAAANGWTNAIDYLLERKVKVDPRATVKADYRSDGYTPLHLAVIHGHLTVVDQLLAAKADPGLVVGLKPEDLPLPVPSKSIPLDGWGEWSSLHFAILFQRREIMTHLLEAKAPLAVGGPIVATYQVNSNQGGGRLNTTWKFGATPLILAVWLNDMTAFKTLIDHGADINQAASEDGETPLLAAIWQTPRLMPTLIDQGAQVTDQFIFGRTALHWAIMKRQPPIILRLIKERADVNIRVQTGQNSYEGHPTPLEAAMRWDFNEEQRDELCEALLKAGARPTPRVLINAAAYGQLKTMNAFIKAGVDPNGSDQEGNRPLHYVKNAQAAQILIEAGALLEVKNHDGVTPFGNIVEQEDTPQSRALIDYLLEKGAAAPVIPPLLFSPDSTLGDRPLIPYVMSKTELVGKSNPKAIMLAFPKTWKVEIGEDLVLPGTPAPSLQELLCLNYQTLTQGPINASRSSSNRPSNSSNRPSNTEVVTDLIIYRPDEKGNLVEVVQLADQGMVRGSTPALQWGDIVLFRTGPKENDKQLMPLIHYVGGLESRTVTFKVGPWEHKVSIENIHLTVPGLELQDHFSANTELIDLTKIVLRRANGESKTINLTLTHDPKKFRLMDGDVIEYSLKEQTYWSDVDPFSSSSAIQIFFPDRPAREGAAGRNKEMTLSEFLHSFVLLEGRDFSKLTIQRMGKDKLERIPLDLLAASRSLADGETAMAKAVELLNTTIFPGDILLFPPKENITWQQRNSYTNAAEDSEIEALVALIKPAPRPSPNRAPVPTRATPSKTPRNVVPPRSR